jgi:uncharacterized GH25 family protein
MIGGVSAVPFRFRQEDRPMRRLAALVTFLAIAAPARAHFVWILPPEKPGQPARVVFSDGPHPDKPELLKKIAHAEFFLLEGGGKAVSVKATPGQDALEVALPPGKGPCLLGGVCRYGVFQRGQAEPFLLHYYPKAILGNSADDPRTREVAKHACDKLPLQVVAAEKGATVRVLWHGKPLASAEVTVHKPGQAEPLEGKTDADGLFQLGEKPAGRGVVGIRVGHTEAAPGELDGKKYQSVKHYATLTFLLDGPAATPASAEVAKPAEDAAATKLLADARAARASWENFPGFGADLEVNIDGKVTRGTMTADPKGKVTVQLGDPEAQTWAKRMLTSIVGHRLGDGGDLHTPCAFADEVADHPLGRAIRVLNDEFHSSYRIRDRQVIEVNRAMKDTRFTITVIENRLTPEKHYLPSTYAVNYWDLKSGALQKSEAHLQTWQRIGRFDLPLGAAVVTAYPGKQEARELKLSNVRLAEGTH